MDRVLNPKDEKQTIYEIYRACRLCGAGAGYKMPIIQNVIDLDGDGVELRQKIKECVQIEVNHTDRMPPLICELCVDKVNEFYEFLDMCKLNNRRTRLRLGLPLQTRARDSVDSENCILGVTEPVFIESDAEPQKHKNKKARIKKEPAEVKVKTDKEITETELVCVDSDADAEPLSKYRSKKIRIKDSGVKIKIESRPSPKPEHRTCARVSRESSEEPRWANTSRNKNRAPSPNARRTTRQNLEAPLTSPPIEAPKSMKLILKKADDLLIERKLKRPREKETKIDTPPPLKKVKIAIEPVSVSKPGPKSSKVAQKEPPKTTPKPGAKPGSNKDIIPSTPPSKTTPKAPPSKALPSKALPTKAMPTKALPTKALPTKALPTKAMPTKALPTKALPAKALPTKALPAKALPAKATPSPAKEFYCNICNVQLKTSQGYSMHINVKHIPSFTSPKYACNACELWFHTVEETTLHHRNHRNQSIPYKCTRCYGYFKLQQAYEDHFGNDLCLSVYEVPDVKCWECWQTFPTNKLMEDHKCAGEDGRPGGKCGKCKRNYSLLKNLIKHESTCTYKKKGEVKVDPEIKARLLPMQVRIARCDPLLKAKDHVDSSKVSHMYGLDSKSRYPYLSHNIKVKAEPKTKPFEHMVSIEEDVKEEFSNSYVHWDSDNSDVSEASVDTDSSQQKVESLSTISLKTIFSKKCMGRVPRKIRKVKSKFDLVTKINSIIDNLSMEDTQTSCSNDSDSILDKNATVDENKEVNTENEKEIQGNNDSKKDDSGNISPTIMKYDTQASSYDSDSILDKNSVKSAGTVENAKEGDEITQKLNDTPEKHDDSTEEQVNTAVNQETHANVDTTEKPEDVGRNDSSEKHDDTSKEQDDTSDEQDTTAKGVGTPEKLENDNVPGDSIKETISSIGEENDEGIKERDDTKSLVENHATESSVNPTAINDDIKEDDDHNENDDKNENHDTNRQTDAEIKNHDDENEQKDIENDDIKFDASVKTETEPILTIEKDSKNGKIDSNNKLVKSNTELLKSEEILTKHNISDIIKPCSETMDVDDNDFNKTGNDNDDKHDSNRNIEKLSAMNENFSKIDEITRKILNETQEPKNVDEKPTENDISTESHQKSDPHSDSISLNSVSENGVEKQDRFNVNDLSEDDRMLMAELDAQIGENDQKISENEQKIGENDQKIGENVQKFSENDQKFSEHDQKLSEHDQKKTKEHTIEDLLRKQDSDMKSLDLDSISDDEFNFDV